MLPMQIKEVVSCKKGQRTGKQMVHPALQGPNEFIQAIMLYISIT